MNTPRLLHELIAHAAARTPQDIALVDGEQHIDYATLWQQVQDCASRLRAFDLPSRARVAIYLEKRSETIIACFGATLAGLVFVPINPLLKPAQVEHILRDCAVSVLISSAMRLETLAPTISQCPALCRVAGVDFFSAPVPAATSGPQPVPDDSALAAIFYTSGSTGRSKGVMLSHRNLVVGAQSVAQYLENRPDDVLLAALPLSFDAGFSQLTTAFWSGARVILLNYLVPRDVLLALQRHRVTGLTAVPPLYIQLAQLDWPAGCADSLRYFANTGGHMPRDILDRLRARAPAARPFLMYGLTEAFRSTYLPPTEVDRRPDSIGKAIPNVQIHVLRPDGTPCDAEEPGELVHGGPLVSLGYWNNPEASDERFRPLPGSGERCVFSGDTVRRDAEGFLYFVGRRDEMIKTSGYRVSPTEIEEALYASGQVGECVAFGVPHATLGQTIHVIATSPQASEANLLAACRKTLPAYMVPSRIELRPGPLPRNPNGKLDRAELRAGCLAEAPQAN